jgi:hypothetical protein
MTIGIVISIFALPERYTLADLVCLAGGWGCTHAFADPQIPIVDKKGSNDSPLLSRMQAGVADRAGIMGQIPVPEGRRS